MQIKKTTYKTKLISGWLWSDPVRIQTLNLLIRSQMLYSIELQGQGVQIYAKNWNF